MADASAIAGSGLVALAAARLTKSALSRDATAIAAARKPIPEDDKAAPVEREKGLRDG